MSKSFSDCARDFRDALLDFVWQQWCAFGVAGAGSTRLVWPIDPEALLPFSLEVSRHDPRVFDEILDWLLRNGEWVNVQRLSSIIRADCPGTLRLMQAVAATISERRRDSRWRSLDSLKSEKIVEPEPLFSIGGRPWNSGEKTDPTFLRYGFRRCPVSPRGMSHEVPMTSTHCLYFKTRSLFGVNVRADVIAHLVARGRGHASEISRLLGFSQKQVQDTLVEMARSGLVRVQHAGRRKDYWVDLDRWRSFFFGRNCPSIEWIDWRALTRGLGALLRGMEEAPQEPFSDYVASSLARRAMCRAREDLMASKIGVRLEDDRAHHAEAYLDVFLNDVRGIIERLAGSE